MQPGGALEDAEAALASLAEYAPQLAQTYRNILTWDEDYFRELSTAGMALDLSEFSPSLGHGPLTLDNRADAVCEACRYKLLSSREAALLALRAGFTLQPNEGASAGAGRYADLHAAAPMPWPQDRASCVVVSAAAGKHALDLLPQLQLFDAPQLALLIGGRCAAVDAPNSSSHRRCSVRATQPTRSYTAVRGRTSLDTPTLLGCIDWSSGSLVAGGFDDAEQLRTPRMLRQLLADARIFTPALRLHFFCWVTGASPCAATAQRALSPRRTLGGSHGLHARAQAVVRCPWEDLTTRSSCVPSGAVLARAPRATTDYRACRRASMRSSCHRARRSLDAVFRILARLPRAGPSRGASLR